MTPWRRKRQPTSVLLPGKSHRQRSVVGYSPWGCKESDTAEWFFHFLSLLHIWSTGERWRWCGNEEIFRILMEFKRGSHYMNANGKCVNQCFLVSELLPFWAHWLFALGTVLCTEGCRAAPLASTLLSVAQLKARGTSSCLVATPEGFSDIFKHSLVGKVTCQLISISVNNSKKKMTRRGIRMGPGPPLCLRKWKAVKET